MAFMESQGNTIWWVIGTTGPISTDGGVTTSLSTGSTLDGGIEIGQVVAYNGPSGSAGKIDVTNLGSTAKQFLMGLRDEGDISIDVIYDPESTGHIQLLNDRGTRTQRGWIIKIKGTTVNESITGNKLGGRAYCTGFSVTGAVDDAVKATMTLAITGAVEQSSLTTALFATS